jgi:hypothetical protein
MRIDEDGEGTFARWQVDPGEHRFRRVVRATLVDGNVAITGGASAACTTQTSPLSASARRKRTKVAKTE